MKKNILILSLDNKLAKKAAKKVADLLSMHFLDVDELINYELINKDEIEIKCGAEYLKKLEEGCVSNAVEFENCVTVVSIDTFLSNDISVKFENHNQFFLGTSQAGFKEANAGNDKNLVFNDISTFLKNSCNEYISCDNLNVNQIADKIIKKLS